MPNSPSPPADPAAALPPHIDERATVAPGTFLGAGCVVQAGAHIGEGVTLEPGVFVGPNVVFAALPEGLPAPATIVRAKAWIGGNASLIAGITVGARAVVRPGAVVTRSVPPAAIVEGNPANIVGYVNTDAGPAGWAGAAQAPARPGVEITPVAGVTLHRFPVISDLRGGLTVGEFERDIPFKPLRYFMVTDVPNREIRGEHAHRVCHQFLICVRGSCAVVADDGTRRVEVTLDAPSRGLYLPPMTWGVQYKYSADAVLLVFASHHYDAADYIRDYDAFLSAARAAAGPRRDTHDA